MFPNGAGWFWFRWIKTVLMRMNVYTYLVIASLISILSCEGEGDYDPGIYQQWEITDIAAVEQRFYPKDNDYSPFIEFEENGEINLALDVNLCTGSFTADRSGAINISMMGCTKICCDSEFSAKVAETLPLVDSFRVSNNQLHLIVNNWGMLILERPD